MSTTVHWRLRALRLRDHLHDLRQHGQRTNALRAYREAARCIERSADHVVACAFRHWDGLAREHRFIDGARALDHDAVHRHFLARPHTQHVADMDMSERHIRLAAVRFDAARRLRRKAQQRLDRGGRL
jgi:hypothetical protein